MDKPKILVRYSAGSGGSFLCMVLVSLVHPVQPTQYYSGHDDLEQYVVQYHNFQTHLSSAEFQFKFNTPYASDIELAGMLQDRFEFWPTPLPFYIMHSHVVRADAIVKAWPETRVLTIKTQESDQDQIAYNWVCKFLTRFKHRSVLASKLASVQQEYQRLHTVTVDQFGNFECAQDIRLLSWVHKFSCDKFSKRFEQYQPSEPEVTVNFRSLFNGTLADSIELVAKDLGIAYTQAGLNRAQALIRQYAAAQRPVPWTLKLEDYK